MDTNATGRFIAELRKEKGYTQKALAEKLMVTDKAVSRWETGKGFPDTSLLKPLGEVLGVSVSELLSGKRIEETEMKAQTDKLILESLQYTKRMLANTVSVVLLIVGIAFLLSPLFLAGQNDIWIVGLVLTAAAVLGICVRKRGCTVNVSERAYYAAAVALQGVALILESLPFGVVMIFAAGPTERVIEHDSYFSLLPLGYANVTPMLTGILTASFLLMGGIALFRFENAAKLRNRAFICSVIALLFSVAPLLLLGTVGMTGISYGVSGTILASILLQAAANRQS